MPANDVEKFAFSTTQLNSNLLTISNLTITDAFYHAENNLKGFILVRQSPRKYISVVTKTFITLCYYQNNNNYC